MVLFFKKEHLSSFALLWLTVFLVFPLILMAYVSTLKRGEMGGVIWNAHTPEAYIQFLFERDLSDNWILNTDYLQIFARSISLAALTTLITLVIGLPTALWIAFQPARRRPLLVFLVTVPFWTNILVRTYAWMLLLRTGGVIDSALSALHIPHAPLQLLYTPWATGIGLTYSFLPYMILPIYVSLEKLDIRLVEAAFDLGANRLRVLARIIFPLAMPGIAGGIILVFIPGLGSFISPRASGRRQIPDDRQPDPATIRPIEKLALRRRPRLRPAGPGPARPLGRRPPPPPRRMNRLLHFPGAGLVAVLAFIFLYVPILVLIALSFSDSDSLAQWTGLSLRWYAEVAANADMQRSLRNSLVVAAFATPTATLLATMAALAKTRAPQRRSVETLLALPLLVPEIVGGISILLFFVLIGLPLGRTSIVLAHVVFLIPLAYLPVRARLEGLDPALAEAAADLHATPWQAFRRIILPLIAPGIAAGAMLAFIGSLGDVVISFFVSGPGATTLPVYVFGMVRMGVTPAVNAISTLLLAGSVSIYFLSTRISRRFRPA